MSLLISIIFGQSKIMAMLPGTSRIPGSIAFFSSPSPRSVPVTARTGCLARSPARQLKPGIYRRCAAKGKGEISSSCDAGGVPKAVPRAPVPAQFPTETHSLSLHNSTLHTHQVGAHLLKGEHLAENKARLHLINWTTCNEIRNLYERWLNMHWVVFTSRFTYTLPSRCVF